MKFFFVRGYVVWELYCGYILVEECGDFLEVYSKCLNSLDELV